MPVFYADTGNHRLQESLQGGAYNFGKWTEGDTIKIGLRTFERRNGRAVETSRVCKGVKVSLSLVDQRPEHGTWKIKYGALENASVEGENLTTALAFDATAAQVKAALAALTDLTTDFADFSDDGTVELVNGSYLIIGLGETTLLTGVANQLRPASEIIVYPYERADESWVHEIRLTQTPVAWADTFEREMPATPTVVRIEAGGTDETVEWPERQELQISGLFRGVIGVSRSNGLKTGPIAFTGDTRQDPRILQNALNDHLLTTAERELSEEQFTVVASSKGALISYDGPSLIGVAQDLLTAYVISAPEGDVTFRLALNRPELWASLRTTPDLSPANERAYQLQIEMLLEDEDDDEIDLPVTVYRGEVIVRRDIARDGAASSLSFNWVHQHRDSHKPHSPDAVITGEHSAVMTFGDGTATTFLIDHALESVNIQQVVVYTNTEPARPLVAWTGTGTAPSDAEYGWVVTNEDRVTITMLNGWASTPAASDGLYAVITAAGPIDTYNNHEQPIETITGGTGDLRTILDGILADIAELQSQTGVGTPVKTLELSSDSITIPLTPIFAVYPGRPTYEAPASGRLGDLIVLGRPGRLFPAVHDTAAESLPIPLPAASTAYQGRVFQYSASATAILSLSGGDRLRPGEYAACDGRIGWYRVEKYAAAESSWYPAALTRDLFSPVEINEYQLRSGRALTLQIGVEGGLIYDRHPSRNRLTELHAELVIEVGYRAAESSPGTPGSNLDAVNWAETPLVAQDIVLTGTPQVHEIGVWISRTDAGRTLKKLLYGKDTAGTAPSANEFLLRGRIRRFDTENAPTDARGFVALSGLARSNAAEPPSTLGLCSIS